jgi:type 1 glutamine amidotransferase
MHELAERGYPAVSFETVARRAGVHKTTLYRRWTRPEGLLLEAALEFSGNSVPLPDSGSLRDDLLLLARHMAESLNSPGPQAMLRAVVTEAKHNPELADVARSTVAFERDIIDSYEQLMEATTPDFTPIYARLGQQESFPAGAVLDTDEQRWALERYIRSGGGYVGIHAAADTEYEWPFYGRLVGAYFHSHPIQQFAEFDNEAQDHPATAHLNDRFSVFDEFYSFQGNPRDDVRVLLTIDEDTYLPDPNTTNIPLNGDGTINEEFIPGESGYMGDHPMSWCHDALGGTAFYTALGHESHLYDQDWYRRHLLGGILVATRQMSADCAPRARMSAASSREE